MYKISVLIPTFKRTNELLYNLNLLESILTKLSLLSDVLILICFDGSSEEHIKAITDCLEQSNLKYKTLINKSNLGLEKTELLLISSAESECAMLLGEDDYLNAELFELEFNYICENKNIGAIIPNYFGIDENKRQIRSPKRRIEKDKIYKSGSLSELYKANQMSGLVFKCSGVVDAYHKLVKEETVYPHLFFIGFNMLRLDTVEITRYPFKNTYIKTKSFAYTADGLLDEILRIYLCFDIDLDSKYSAIKYFLKKDKRRYCNQHTWLHPKKFKQNVNNNYSGIPLNVKKLVINKFYLSYLLMPLFIFSHFWVRIFKGKQR